MVTPVWTQMSCEKCSRTSNGVFSMNGRISVLPLRAAAQETGWRFKGGKSYCAAGCEGNETPAIWTELVCRTCARAEIGHYAAERKIPMRALRADAKRHGWRLVYNECFCSDECVSRYEEESAQPESRPRYTTMTVETSSIPLNNKAPMDNTLTKVARSARGLLAAYLAHFPGEAARYALLLAQLEPGDTSVLRRWTMRGHITTSMVVFDPVTRKVLLAHHGIYREWMMPGGHYEDDLSLWLSGAREVLEETGVVVSEMDWCGPHSAALPIDIDTHPIPPNPAKGEGDHFHHDFTFVATASSSTPLRPQLAEVDEARWFDLAEMHRSPLPRVRRIAAKLEHAFPLTAG